METWLSNQKKLRLHLPYWLSKLVHLKLSGVKEPFHSAKFDEPKKNERGGAMEREDLQSSELWLSDADQARWHIVARKYEVRRLTTRTARRKPVSGTVSSALFKQRRSRNPIRTAFSRWRAPCRHMTTARAPRMVRKFGITLFNFGGPLAYNAVGQPRSWLRSKRRFVKISPKLSKY